MQEEEDHQEEQKKDTGLKMNVMVISPTDKLAKE
jgi:hypothetical protein